MSERYNAEKLAKSLVESQEMSIGFSMDGV